MIERLSDNNWRDNPGHIYRYSLVKKWIKDKDKILDIACGIGYGAQLMSEGMDIQYIGVDKIVPSQNFVNYGKFISNVDLNTWSADFSWDISVCFETLEHIDDPSCLVNELKKANKYVFISVPTRPTKHMNPYHLHDFEVEDILNMFNDLNLVHLEDQPDELSHIFVFQK